jgi:mannose-6-phosphate isomerase-like protein (cupin superfamily)
MIVRHSSVTPIDFGGLQILDYTANHPGTASLAVIEVPPGARHAEAWSKRSDKYYYVISGQIRFALNGVETDLEAGDFCLVSQGERFWYENQAPEAASCLLVHAPSFDLASEVFVEAAEPSSSD